MPNKHTGVSQHKKKWVTHRTDEFHPSIDLSTLDVKGLSQVFPKLDAKISFPACTERQIIKKPPSDLVSKCSARG